MLSKLFYTLASLWILFNYNSYCKRQDSLDIGLVKITGKLDSDTTLYVSKIKEFCNDDSIKALLLYINSTGGSIAGTTKILEAILECKIKKPFVAFIPYMGASCAYWIATHCNAIVTTPTSYIGSIGVYFEDKIFHNRRLIHNNFTYLVDKYTFFSNYKKQQISQESREQNLDILYQAFKDLTTQFRPEINPHQDSVWAEGKVFTGNQACALHLVDYIGSYSTALRIALKLIQEKTPYINLTLKQIVVIENPEVLQ